jgi:hypothetical protein
LPPQHETLSPFSATIHRVKIVLRKLAGTKLGHSVIVRICCESENAICLEIEPFVVRTSYEEKKSHCACWLDTSVCRHKNYLKNKNNSGLNLPVNNWSMIKDCDNENEDDGDSGSSYNNNNFNFIHTVKR